MWEEKPYSLFVGEQTSEATMRISVDVTQKPKQASERTRNVTIMGLKRWLSV